ncbi:MAG: hypothetical protein HDT42_12475 [Ruminococcaceae bacterium]|nr:hypothetical protein [Oscillospiraceae bacterium]
MEFVIGWSIFGILVSVLFFAVSETKRRSKTKAAIRAAQLAEKKREEFLRNVKYNREHLPYEAMPPFFHPITDTVDSIILTIGVDLYDGRGEMLRELCDYDGDSVRLVDMINKNIWWFVQNPTGETISEQCEVMREFLRKQYCISEESIEAVVKEFCWLCARFSCL